MEITFIKPVTITLDFDVEAIAEYIVKEWKNKYPLADISWIYDEVSDNIYYYLEKFGLTEEDENAIIDADIDGYNVLGDFIKTIQDYIENKYHF